MLMTPQRFPNSTSEFPTYFFEQRTCDGLRPTSANVFEYQAQLCNRVKYDEKRLLKAFVSSKFVQPIPLHNTLLKRP